MINMFYIFFMLLVNASMFENMYVYNCLCAHMSALQTYAGVDEGTGGG